MAVETQKDDLDAIEAALLEINDDTQCCLCNAMLVVDDGDGQWDRMDHKPDCPFLAYVNLLAELRAARAVIAHMNAVGGYMGDASGLRCRVCDALITRVDEQWKGHWLDCPLLAYDTLRLVQEQGRGRV